MFPCFVCSQPFCFDHALTHACTTQRLPIMHFVEPTMEVRPRLDVRPYLRLGGLDSTICLELLVAKADLSGWSGTNEDLSGSHHIFPKGALVWVFEHMTRHQQTVIRKLLTLPANAGGLALTRLRSNLIDPRNAENVAIRPEWRNDDAHHHGGSGLVGEEFQDLVRTVSGALEHRSRCYRALAWFVAQNVAPRFLSCAREGRDAFTITDGEATIITTLILQAETLHYYLEQDPTMPSHHGARLWRQDRAGKYFKGAADDRSIPHALVRQNQTLTLGENYRARRRLEEQAQRRRYLEARRDESFDPDPPRLRQYKSSRLGGWHEPPAPSKGTRGWLRGQCKTQVQVDVAMWLDNLIVSADDGVGRWTDDAPELVNAIATAFQTAYDFFRGQAQEKYSTHREAYKWLPSFRAAMSDLGDIEIWIENSWPPGTTNYARTNPWRLLDRTALRCFRRYPEGYEPPA